MTFEELLDQTLALLQRRERISYRALKRQFDLDDDWLADLVFELVQVLEVAADKDGIMLIWEGQADSSGATEIKVHPSLQPVPVTANLYSAIERSPSAAAERRQLTVMFCDMVNSTSLSEQFDPEDLREIFLAYQDSIGKVTALFGGHIAKFLGDGLLIYFGYPQAHEDDAQRAVRGGLGILEAIERLNRRLEDRWGATLAVRIGIHTGLVVAGEMGNRDLREPMAIVGEAPNISARLQEVAQSNTLVISKATKQLIAGFFECQFLGETILKGISKPISTYQVTHESTAKSRLDVAEQSGLSPLVGRDKELALLLDCWAQAKRGHSRIVELGGDAGIGKSRLVWALKEQVADESNAWLSELRGLPYYRNSSFYSIIEQLEQVVLRFGREEDTQAKLAKIEGFLTQYGLPLEQGVPLVASLLSVPFQPSYEPLALTPERQKQETIKLMVQVLLLRAAQQPVLLVIEDLHWMDASTLNMLNHLIDKGAQHSILILLTFRPEFTPSWENSLRLVSIPLMPLTSVQAGTLVGTMAGSKVLPGKVVDQIVAKTDGTPLYLEELTKTVLEFNFLPGENSGEVEVSERSLLAIPATLQDSLIARLDRLSRVKEIAQLGATIGREFNYELIAAASSWDLGALRHGLEQLVQAGLLYQQGIPPQASYHFKHALIQDAAYQSLLKSRRQSYHLHIAEVLETQLPNALEGRLELLAHHYEEAGRDDSAVLYYMQAGKRAVLRSACVEAISHLTQGLTLLQKLPYTPDRDQRELELQIYLAPAYMATRGWAATEVEQTCDRIRTLSQTLSNSETLATALWGLWTNYFMRGDFDKALNTARDVQRRATSSGDPKLAILAHHALGYTAFYQGNFSQAQAHAEQGLALYDPETEQEIIRTFQMASFLAFRIFLAGSLWMQGYPEQAEAQIQTGFKRSAELSHPASGALLLGTSCFFYHYAQDSKWVRENTEALLKSAREEGFLLWVAVAAIYHGWSLTIQGKIDAGIKEIEEGVVLFRKTGSSITLPHIMVMMAEAFWTAGRIEEALDILNEGMQEASRRQEHHMEPELYRLNAEILMTEAMTAEGVAGELSFSLSLSTALQEAESLFQQALDLSHTQNALMLELRAAVGLTRLWQSQGKAQDAHQFLSEIYDRFTEGLESPDLQAARTRLEELERTASDIAHMSHL
ncbi:Adenylate cyclase 1 [Acaryochloris thomasi RCC1774]|uniref:Adenylate cyclase 1 n=1 Tax=Acaryochloris thomasi RCC1774 TaxID=1764569 RepID=A0A2W1JH52_9CYAN|nr:adenylate/guanylate cyclase domain-containing protein [Acaryochloris thomasi]PZD72706.1 Adenylate cyclase 1 [Acaryochloris thomasi RCC1774]